jgi:hypothetical protein
MYSPLGSLSSAKFVWSAQKALQLTLLVLVLVRVVLLLLAQA